MARGMPPWSLERQLVAVGVALLLATADAAYPNSTYAIDLGKVLVADPAASSSWAQELGPCICDLTYELCDVGCVCDTDCSASEIALFTSLSPSGPNPYSIQKCVDSSVVQVNQRGELLANLLDNLLCVQTTNNAKLGDFLTPSPIVTSSSGPSSSQFNLIRGTAAFAFQTSRPATINPGIINYKAGSNIVGALIAGPATQVPYRIGFLTLPTPGASSFTCTDDHFATFLEPKSTRCRRFVDVLSTSCVAGGVFDASTYTTGIRIGKMVSALPETIASFVDIAVTTTFQDPTTRATSALVGVQVPVYDAVSCMCQNALKSVSYQFFYAETGMISSVTASVVLTNVAAIGATCIAGLSGAGVQSFTTSFVRDWATSVNRPKSGSPGYLLGLPVLSGLPLVTGKTTAIQQDISGLTVAAAGPTGACSLLIDDRIPVTFDENMISSCTLSLTAAQLASRCQSGGVLEYLTLPTDLHIGQWGSSTFSNHFDWTVLENTAATTEYEWSASHLTCTNIISSINLEFLTAELGSIYNRQTKIVAARATYGTDTWKMRFSRTSDTQTTFEVKTTVLFIPIGPNAGVTTPFPPTPPILPQLPSDVLYPLFMGSNSNSASLIRPVINTILALATTAVAMQWQS